MPGPSRVILVSILSLGRPQNILNQLAVLPAWLDQFAHETGILSHIIVRNNDPQVDFSDVAEFMREREKDYPCVTCSLVTEVPNNGFGEGHNSNIAHCPSDYVLVLNDDIGFPHLTWLGEAISMLTADPRTVCVGADENPKHVNYAYGNGQSPGAFHLHTLPYAEASVLLFDRAAFDRLGGFSTDFRWAMCEDSDLSLRVQQNGWRIAHISMPHQHWRSTSFNALPSAVKSSILEHNRAALFANWRDSLTAGRVGRYEVFDICSDGLGDIFCALPHLRARLASMGSEQRGNIVVNTNHPELFGWLRLDGVRLTSVRDLAQLRADLDGDGIAALRTMRDVNFSLPFNIHPLLAGGLGIAHAEADMMADFTAILRGLKQPGGAIRFPRGSYCVVHIEFDRDHEGRGLAPAPAAALLTLCGRLFDRIVLVGRERRMSAAQFGATKADILDLQGTLSLSQLAAVIAHARYFVGIDSFPAHVAQACGVASSICFGAIHPLARVWNQANVWPITAPLDCIGCYHTHLEASVPFCMRRDVACTQTLAAASMQACLADMIAGRNFAWERLALSWHKLQARLIKLARYHPAPPERLFRGPLAPNEQISNAIYRMTEQVGNLLQGHYHTSTMTALAAQTAELQAELYATRIALDEAKHSKPAPSPMSDGERSQQTTRIMQLHTLTLTPVRCRLDIADQWIDIEATDDDPQIQLPVLRGASGKVQLRLSSVADAGESLQVYWATGDGGYSPEQVHTFACTGGMQTVNLILDMTDGESLHIRIDPITSGGRARLRGSLGGQFVVLDQSTARETTILPVLAPAQADSILASDMISSQPAVDDSVRSNANTAFTRRARHHAAEPEHA